MAMSSVKYDVGCTASHRPASSLRNSSPNTFTRQVTARARSPLVIDDFGVKYTKKDDVEHLMNILKQGYKIDTDWEGTHYLGLALN